jgi:hypothetical protein
LPRSRGSSLYTQQRIGPAGAEIIEHRVVLWPSFWRAEVDAEVDTLRI